MKKKHWDKALNVIAYLFLILPFAMLGAYAAASADALVPDKGGAETGRELMFLAVIIILGVVFYLLHLILHEGGHLIAGLIKGYGFLSFRVGSLTLVKREGKMQWKKTTVVGTGGQCLMIPPKCEPKDCPFALYLIGGGMVNLITAAVAFFIAIPVSGLAEIVLNCFAIVGMGVGLSNLVPLKTAGIANDGYQLFIENVKNPKSKEILYCLLSANALLTDSEKTTDLPKTLQSYIMNADYSNLKDTSVANLLCFKNSLLMESEQYEEARKNYERLATEEGVLEIFKREAICELIYMELVGDCNRAKIDEYMDKEQRDYIKATAVYPSRKRLMYAYYLIYDEDKEKAEAEYEALLKVCKTHPSKAECTSERQEADRLRERFASEKESKKE